MIFVTNMSSDLDKSIDTDLLYIVCISTIEVAAHWQMVYKIYLPAIHTLVTEMISTSVILQVIFLDRSSKVLFANVLFVLHQWHWVPFIVGLPPRLQSMVP